MPPLNDLDIATICSALYSDQPDGYWTHLWPHDTGYCALKRVQDHFDVVVWRGSTTLADWIEDLNAAPINDPKLGMCHSGFLKGVQSVVSQVRAAIARPVVVTGHSLGAGHALIHAAMLRQEGEDFVRVTTFGSPCPGGVGLSHVLWDAIGHDYKNRADRVTDLPKGFGFMHPRPLTLVDVAPSLMDAWGPLADHHMPLYHTAMQGLFQPTL